MAAKFVPPPTRYGPATPVQNKSPVLHHQTAPRTAPPPHMTSTGHNGSVVQPIYWALGAFVAYNVVTSAIDRYRTWRNPAQPESNNYEVAILYSQSYSKRMHDFGNDHVSIGLFENGKLIKGYGIWVHEGEKGPLSIGVRGEIRDDTKKWEADTHRDRERRFRITKEQYTRVEKRILRDQAKPPRFDYTGFVGESCVTWALRILREEAGITMPNPNWLFPRSPEDLGEQLHRVGGKAWE